MSQGMALALPRKGASGWIGIGAILLVYAALFALNFWLPLAYGNYTTRIWDWSQTALTVTAFLTLILNRRFLEPRAALLGLALAVLSALSHWLHNPSFLFCLQEGVAVLICFLSGVVLFKDLETGGIPAFQPPLARIGRSLAFGVAVALPLAIVNNLYFYFNAGPLRFQNPFSSASEALSPGIHEEVVFRFFVLALCLNLLKSSPARQLVMAVSLFLAVVPHSLNHLPDLFLDNPVMGLVMLAATSLLFGLPMAVLQVKHNLETAIAFHWFIDFARFLFGF